MKISIVIPAYNEEKYIGKTLESLRNQSIMPDEIIVINASSTDGTETVSKLGGAIVITVPHKTVGYSRQVGIERATGDIVIFTDADTIHPTHWVERVRYHLEKPNVSCVTGIFKTIDGPLPYRIFTNIVQPIQNQVLYAFGLVMATGQNLSFWRKKALAVGGIPKNYKIAEDLELARRLKKVGKVIFDRNLIVYSSGRRGNEGFGFIFRNIKAFFYYFIFRKADIVGFPDIR